MKTYIKRFLLTTLVICSYVNASELVIKETVNSDVASVSHDPKYCIGAGGVVIPKGSTVVLTGTSSCTISYSKMKSDFVEIAYDGKILLMNPKNVQFDSNDILRIETLTSSEKEDLRKEALTKSMMIKLDAVDGVFKDVKRTSSSGIALMKATVYDESSVTEGTGIEIQYLNSTNKRIKYVTATVVGYNGVDDPVRATFSKKYEVVLKGVGPIEPDETATYKKEYAWHTDVVEYLKIKSIRVEYMDGTTKTITKPDSIQLKESTISMIERGKY